MLPVVHILRKTISF